MKKINATRDEIIKMLKSGEIVFAAYCEDHFLLGQGIILYDNKPAYAFKHRELGANLIDYGRPITEWYVDYAKPFRFQVGDICEFGGVEGVITDIRPGFHEFHVFWESFSPTKCFSFTAEGFLMEWHTKPLLNFIRRPKKKVKKTIEIVTWVEVDERGNVVEISMMADPWSIPEKHKLLKSIATTEIEVEEE